MDFSAPLRFDIVSLFPDFFTSPLAASLIGRALKRQIVSVQITNPRDFTTDKHHKVDDIPYGGGVGMVMKPEPIFAAVESLPQRPRREVILMTPQGQTMDQPLFKQLSTEYDQLVIICGHYEGVDERVLNLVTREVSLGDFVLTGGEVPALALLNGVVRLIPGTVGKSASLQHESFETPLLDYPQYTRPAQFRQWAVPEVLRSGDHGAIALWRQQQQLERTEQRRPDLFERWQSAGTPLPDPLSNPVPSDHPSPPTL
ncbi:MAG: tRNA (guanosine(37)-N1)-methyltransferase TrmD [Phormidesmis sp.]